MSELYIEDQFNFIFSVYLCLLTIGLLLNSSSWTMVRGKDYMGNLSEIQERFVKGKYKGGNGYIKGKMKINAI